MKQARQTKAAAGSEPVPHAAEFPSEFDWLSKNTLTGKDLRPEIRARHKGGAADVAFYVWWEFGCMGAKLPMFVTQPACAATGGRAKARATAKAHAAREQHAPASGGAADGGERTKREAKEQAELLKAKTVALKEFQARQSARTSEINEAANMLSYMRTHLSTDTEQIAQAEQTYFNAMRIVRPDLDEIIAHVLTPGAVHDAHHV